MSGSFRPKAWTGYVYGAGGNPAASQKRLVNQGLFTLRRAMKATRKHKYQMDPIMEVLIDLLTHRVDVYVLRLVSGGQFIEHSVFA